MDIKNTKPTAAEFFRKYSDLVSEAEKDTKADDKKDKKEEVKKDDKKDKKATLKESTLAEKYMGFEKVEKAAAKNPKVRDPGAVAASIGREKYGKGKFQKMAAAGKKDEGCMEESKQLDEKWGKEAKLNPAKKGMFKGKTKAELQKQLSNLKASGPHKEGSKEYTKQKELNFAIRAKGHWKESVEPAKELYNMIVEAEELLDNLYKQIQNKK